eukprot:NODE_3988_length_1952_cov_3.370411.p1 GENE.NODE_3988_length_1952_cov_3.370411~~NODE_3988_length_1952_cov_3.370411.p1  ORF type:complete len:296 (+),score=75.20 NODE_3988_length_1952_cov_3.370411:465-1352(+)
MTMRVFDHEIQATFELSVEGRPRSMVVKMKEDEAMRGAGPPPPPVPYIFDFPNDDGEELWLCHPVHDSPGLPTEFAGPGLVKMKRVPAQAVSASAALVEPLDVRCAHYMKAMSEILPALPQQLPELPSHDEIQRELVMTGRLSQLKQHYGVKVHRRAVELAKIAHHRREQAGVDAELMELACVFRARLVARRLLPDEEVPTHNAQAEQVELTVQAEQAEQAMRTEEAQQAEQTQQAKQVQQVQQAHAAFTAGGAKSTLMMPSALQHRLTAPHLPLLKTIANHSYSATPTHTYWLR